MHAAVPPTACSVWTGYSFSKPFMLSRQKMTDYGCEKPCKFCLVTGNCPRVCSQTESATVSNAQKPRRNWQPNMEPKTPLKCGCNIPWPIVQHFGTHLHGQVFCSVHGWQPKLTKAEIEKTQRAAKKLVQQETFDDICPF